MIKSTVPKNKNLIFKKSHCRFYHLYHKYGVEIAAFRQKMRVWCGGGRESAEVYKYLALANNAANVFTLSQYAMPNSLYERKSNEIIPKLNKLRAGLGIVKDCDKLMSCDQANHDPLYFKTGNPDPTIFFTLNY